MSRKWQSLGGAVQFTAIYRVYVFLKLLVTVAALLLELLFR